MREFPAANRITGSFADGDLVFLTISNDKNAEEIEKIIEKVGTSLPVLLDKGSNAWAAYRVRLLPTHYLIDQDQKVSRVWTGPVEDREAEIIDNIKSLLKPDAPSPPE